MVANSKKRDCMAECSLFCLIQISNELFGQSFNVVESFLSTVFSNFAEFFFDSHQLVVLGDTVSTAHGTCLDLAGVDTNYEVSDCSIFGFTGTVVPIWLTLIRTALAAPSSIPFLMNVVFVTNRSSPTS